MFESRGLESRRAIVAALCAAIVALALVGVAPPARAVDPVEPPALAEAVAAGRLPPVASRLPAQPAVVRMDSMGKSLGRHGGELRSLIRKSKDVKLLAVYGYARLVGYGPDYRLVPDILENLEVEESRRFTLTLRAGHRWSDGHPFTTEDFRYWWEDVATDAKLSTTGPPHAMLVDGKPPVFELLDERRVRFTWHKPNAVFLQRLASASPLFPYLPAHYMKQFHARYADPQALAKAVSDARAADWTQLHDRHDNLYLSNNPELPTLQPWVNQTRPPSTRFVAERNPYFHRVDEEGRQLPYLDRVILSVASGQLIPAKTAAGESDLQARGLTLADYTMLKENEERSGFSTHLWRPGVGAQIALFPNLNVNDPVWRELIQDLRFRRALSLGIDRHAINQVRYYGLAVEGNNTVLEESPLFRKAYRDAWAVHDPDKASALLDELGLTARNPEGTRLLSDGRPLEIIVETAGEQPEQVDVLQLITSDWAELGIKLLVRPRQREVMRRRVFAGDTVMSAWSGLSNAVPTANMSPAELAPTSRQDLAWPRWGAHYETAGKSGEPPDLPVARDLLALYTQWRRATTTEEREATWHEMLTLWSENVLSIGVVAGVPHPVVARSGLENVPDQGIYAWDPGAVFGIYRPDTFWWR